MAAFTDEGEALVLNLLMRGDSMKVDGIGGSGSNYTLADSGLFLSLWKTNPTDTGAAGSEAQTPNFSGGGTNGYIRKAIAWTAISATTTGDTTISNTSAITWTATGNWTTGSDTVGFFGIHLGSADANEMILHGSLAVAKPVTSGDTVTVAAGDLDVILA